MSGFYHHPKTNNGMCEDVEKLTESLKRQSVTDSKRAMSPPADDFTDYRDKVDDPSENVKSEPSPSMQKTKADGTKDYHVVGAFIDDSNSSSKEQQVRSKASGNKPIISQPSAVSTDPSLRDLNQNDIGKLAMHLNSDSVTVIKNWRHLARKCGITESERDEISRAYSGGGNPALVFFMKLRKENNTSRLSDLVCRLKELKRNDCVSFLQSQDLDMNTKICHLSEDLIEQLANKLTEKNVVINCWKNVACLYGYSRTEIANISSTIRESGQHSPTHVLFQKLSAKNPDMKISSLVDILRGMERNDVVGVLEKIIKNKSS